MDERFVSWVCKQLTELDLILFRRQYAIGQKILSQVGRTLQVGKAKGERLGKGHLGDRRENGLTTVCSQLSDAVQKKTGRGYSTAWFKYCYYYARGFNLRQYKKLVKKNPTQNLLMSLCFKPPAEIDAALASDNLTSDPRGSKRRKNAPPVDHGLEHGHAIVFDDWKDPEDLEHMFANIMTRYRDRLAEIADAFNKALERVKKLA